MLQVIAAVAALLLSPGDAPAQPAPDRPATGITQHGAQPNAGEVRPGSRDGDQPSASAGEVRPREAQRIFGLPVTTALLIAAAIIALVAIAGFVVPEGRRRRTRGNGTYGRSE